MTELLHFRPRVQGEVVDFTGPARNLTREFADGYLAAIAWMESGAPVEEADLLADFYEVTRPGRADEDATRYVDADRCLNLLAAMHRLGHGGRFEVTTGDEIRAEFVRDYGDQWADWELARRVFFMYACGSFYDGLMTAVWQTTRG